MNKGKDVIKAIPKDIRITAPEVSKRKKYMAVMAYFENGYDLEAASRITGHSPELISQWYELYGKEVIKASESPAVVASEVVKEIVKIQEENMLNLAKLKAQTIARMRIAVETSNKPDDLAKVMDAITRSEKSGKDEDGSGDQKKLKKGNVYNLINTQQVIMKGIQK